MLNHTLDENYRKIVHSVLVHADYGENLENNIALLHIESFDGPDSADILTAIDSPDAEDTCKIVGWLRQVRLNFKRRAVQKLVYNTFGFLNCPFSYNLSNVKKQYFPEKHTKKTFISIHICYYCTKSSEKSA